MIYGFLYSDLKLLCYGRKECCVLVMYLFLWYDINFLKDNVLKFKLR